jgi:hypothetical protein
MRSILVLSLLISLCGSADAASGRHARRAHAAVHPYQGMVFPDPTSSYAHAPAGAAEPYLGASQGYAPGERERFIDSVRRGG